jgi:hypothetical protein
MAAREASRLEEQKNALVVKLSNARAELVCLRASDIKRNYV